MPRQQVSVTVESSAYGLGKDIGEAIADIAAKKNAGQVLTDEMANLTEIIAGASAVAADMKDSQEAFWEGALLGMRQGMAPLFPVPAATAPAAATSA